MPTFTEEITIDVVMCGECGISFGMPAWYRKARLNDHRTFYCPNGHPRAYRGESDADKVQRLSGQLDQERTRRQQAEARERHENQQRRRVQTRLRNVQTRIKAGVCPCCNRTFKQLAAHMANKHPEFVAEGTDAS